MTAAAGVPISQFVERFVEPLFEWTQQGGEI
jgi:hypothetical protein